MHALNKLPLVVNWRAPSYSTLLHQHITNKPIWKQKTSIPNIFIPYSTPYLHCDQGNFLTRFVLLMMLHPPLGRCHHRDMHFRPCIFDSLLSGGSGTVIVGYGRPEKLQEPSRHPTARPQMRQWNTWHEIAPISINRSLLLRPVPWCNAGFFGRFWEMKDACPFFLRIVTNKVLLPHKEPISPPYRKKSFCILFMKPPEQKQPFLAGFCIPRRIKRG